jgi:hypothetical protein
MSVVTISLTDLIRDNRLRYRMPAQDEGYSQEAAVERYREAFEEYGGWGSFPPLKVLKLAQQCPGREPGTSYYVGSLILVGGYTRVEAAEWAAIEVAPCDVVHGTWADALALAWTENTTHGRPRTHAELVLVVADIRRMYPDWSLSRVATAAGCHKSAVWRIDQAKKREDEGSKPDGEVDPEDTFAGQKTKPRQVVNQVSRDMWGRPLPASLVPLFEPLPDLIAATKRIEREIDSILKLKHGPDGSWKAKQQPAGLRNADLTTAHTTIRDALLTVRGQVPFIVCPGCDGKDGCEVCEERGYLYQEDVEHLEPDLEQRAKAYMFDRGAD